MKDEHKLRTLKGVVIKKKSLKTIVVKIERKILHPVYKKVITKSTNLHVHDSNDLSNEGDFVLIKESRPYSKTKSWLLLQIFSKNS